VLLSLDAVRAVVTASKLILFVPPGVESLVDVVLAYVGDWMASRMETPTNNNTHSGIVTRRQPFSGASKRSFSPENGNVYATPSTSETTTTTSFSASPAHEQTPTYTPLQHLFPPVSGENNVDSTGNGDGSYAGNSAGSEARSEEFGQIRGTAALERTGKQRSPSGTLCDFQSSENVSFEVHCYEALFSAVSDFFGAVTCSF
jgi:hypothetical protein